MGTSKGGLSTVNRELAIHLAKYPTTDVTFFLPRCSEDDETIALSHNIKIVQPTKWIGYEELELLSFPPDDLEINIVVGHGVKLGLQAQVIRNSRNCKWVQVVHTDPEELGMFKSYPNPISRGEEKHSVEVQLCEKADFVVGVGPKLSEAFRRYLRWCEKDQTVFDFTPGIFDEFVRVKQSPEERKERSVLVFGRGDAEDFELKGFDIAGTAVASLPDTVLVFFGAPSSYQDEIKQRFLQCKVPAKRLRVRSYDESRESLKRLFCQVDLVLMPSRTDGFGLTGLEALSAGLPILVSKNSGFGEALSKLPFGASFVIDSEDPEEWVTAIKKTWEKDRQSRLQEADFLRSFYKQKFNWFKQSGDLLEKMINLIPASSPKIEVEGANLEGNNHTATQPNGVEPKPDQRTRTEEKRDEEPRVLSGENTASGGTQPEVKSKVHPRGKTTDDGGQPEEQSELQPGEVSTAGETQSGKALVQQEEATEGGSETRKNTGPGAKSKPDQRTDQREVRTARETQSGKPANVQREGKTTDGGTQTRQNTRPVYTSKMPTRKAKSVSADIKNAMELAPLMTNLGISYAGLTTPQEMKDKVTKTWAELPSWEPEQAFSIISEITRDNIRKRKVLLDFYVEADNLVGKLDETHMNNVKENLKQQTALVEKEEHCLLIAGETSAGKSSLLNLLLGEEILPVASFPSAPCICELKYGEERTIVAHFKDKDPETRQPTRTITVPLLQPTESFQISYLEQISPYVHGSEFMKVELFWPHSLLKNGLTIIDSPGIGESEIMDDMVIQYLPKAVAVIYVIDSARAGGIQKDRLGARFERSKAASLHVQRERASRATHGKEPLDSQSFKALQTLLLPKCALFVCNKWDQIPEGEIIEVKKYVIQKLVKFCPGLDPESQIIYLSTKEAINAQNYGFVTKEFSSLMNGIRSVLSNNFAVRLEVQWSWLNDLSSRVTVQAKTLVSKALGDRKKAEEVFRRLQVMEDKHRQVMARLKTYCKARIDNAVEQLSIFLSSDEVKKSFTSWTLSDLPKQAGEIDQKISARFEDLIEKWEEEKKVLKNLRESLLQAVEQNFISLQTGLQENIVAGDNPDRPRNRANSTVLEGRRLGMTAAAVVGGLALGTSGRGVLSVVASAASRVFSDVASNSTKNEDRRMHVMATRSAMFLDKVTHREKLSQLVRGKLRDVEESLKQLESHLLGLIAADKQLYQQLQAKKGSEEELQRVYQRITKEGIELKGRLALFGIKDVCGAQIRSEDLDWKEDATSQPGSGVFGKVYQGKMTKDGVVKYVTLKVSKDNAISVMAEIKILRILEHPNIVKFYGIALQHSKGVDTGRVILVMEKCIGDLKSLIFGNPESTPAKSGDPVVLREACRWVKETTDALSFIHGKRIVHRDLKLEKIWLSEENAVKIADVGLAKSEVDITSCDVETLLYMAPEVFCSQLYNNKTDIYSLGIILWEIWYGTHPFTDAGMRTGVELFSLVDCGIRPGHREGYKRPPEQWNALMNRCWDGNPEKRPTAEVCNQEITKLYEEL